MIHGNHNATAGVGIIPYLPLELAYKNRRPAQGFLTQLDPLDLSRDDRC